jgi:signal transduction histidine kinase
VPYRVNELLTAGFNDDLRVVFETESKLPAAGSAVGVVVIGAVTFFGAAGNVDRPVLLGVLLAIATLPFVVQCFVEFSHSLVEVLCLAPLVLINLFGSALGVMDPGGHDQTSLMIAIWLVGETASIGRRRDVIVVTLVVLAMTVGRWVADPKYSAAIIWSSGVGIALLAGLFIRALVLALVNSKRAETALLEQATTNERQRIAREVHDVIAHSLTVTMLHLTAARLAVGRGDNDAATEALEEAERAGRTSLNEIRHTVGLLRADGQPDTTPQPSAGDVPALVEGYRAAGLDVALDLHGDLVTIEPAAGLALYRIVQESLTNAGRHAPGAHTTVHIDTGPPLHLDVRSEGGTPAVSRGSGLGLAGMAERAAALGGMFEAGSSGGGWRVAATLP